MLRIDRAPVQPASTPSTTKPSRKEDATFSDVLVDSLESAASEEAKADDAVAKMLSGEGGIHEAVIAQEKAAIAIRFAVTLKNKAVEAYREVMNTQV